MKIERMTEIETNDIRIGDRIHVGHYTATCQEITPKGALFFLDQYLNKAFPMNWNDMNEGRYEKSDLRKALQSDEVLNVFADVRDYMVPFDNGDLLRIPFAGEYEWGWINNKVKSSSIKEIIVQQNQFSTADFCLVNSNGDVLNWNVSSVIGVRPIFLISLKKEDMMTQDTIKKSAPEYEKTVLDTFNEKQRLVLYYIVGKAVEDEETILDVLDTLNEKQRFVNKAVEDEETILDVLVTLNDKQRLVLNCIVNKAVKDAKKGKRKNSVCN